MSVGQGVEQGGDLGGERIRRDALRRMQPPDLARALRRGQRVAMAMTGVAPMPADTRMTGPLLSTR